MPTISRRVQLSWLFIVAGMCCLAWLLVLHHLSSESLWYDEWITWDFSRRGPVGLVQATIDDVHPPLYYVWVWLWMTVTQSQNLFVMRLTSVIPAVLSAALCYRLGRWWFNSRWAGLGAATFLSTSGIMIYYARELRMYTFVVLLALLSWLFLWQFLYNKRKRPWLYALTVILMAYTYYFTVFMVAVQFIIVVLFYRSKIKWLIATYALTLLALLPWIPAFMHQIRLESVRAGRDGSLTLNSLGKFAATQPTSWETIGNFITTYSAGQGAFTLLLVGLALLLGWSAGKVFRRSLIVASLWLFGTVILFFGVNLIIPVYNLRYVLMVVPAIALLATSLIAHFDRRYVQIGLVSIIGAAGIFFHTNAFLPPKPPHNELLNIITEGYQPGDRIWYNLAQGALGSSLYFEMEYYLAEVIPQLDTDIFVWDAPRDFANLESAPRVWDVRPYWISMPQDAADALTNGRALLAEHEVHGYTVRLYTAPPLEQEPATIGDLFDAKVSPSHSAIYRPGDRVTINSWWRALDIPPLDYSFGLYLRSQDGVVITQVDGGLVADGKPTSQWSPEENYVPIPLTLNLPNDLPDGDYSLWLSVYDWQNPQPLPISAPPDWVVDTSVPLLKIGDTRLQTQ